MAKFQHGLRRHCTQEAVTRKVGGCGVWLVPRRVLLCSTIARDFQSCWVQWRVTAHRYPVRSKRRLGVGGFFFLITALIVDTRNAQPSPLLTNASTNSNTLSGMSSQPE